MLAEVLTGPIPAGRRRQTIDLFTGDVTEAGESRESDLDQAPGRQITPIILITKQLILISVSFSQPPNPGLDWSR